MCVTHVDLKVNTWSFRIGWRGSSINHHSLVYKVDNPIQSSLLSPLVLTQYKVHSLD